LPFALFALLPFTKINSAKNGLRQYPEASVFDRMRLSVSELPVIQKTYDLIKWYVPILNRLPREHKFLLGDRMVTGLYNLQERLIQVRYAANIRK
jgi:hypothetical protein